jgi:hypothetical protein
MRKRTLSVLLSLIFSSAGAQGLVNFFNNSATLFSARPDSPARPGGSQGLYYFALLTAPEGTTDPNQFSFSGLYATNQTAWGRFFGGNAIAVPGWLPGTSRSYLVAGWTPNLGHDWNPSWLDSVFINATGFFGFSSIGSGVAGGFNGTGPIPPLNLFGGATGIQSGFELYPVNVPEPSALGLVMIGVASLHSLRAPWRRRYEQSLTQR